MSSCVPCEALLDRRLSGFHRKWCYDSIIENDLPVSASLVSSLFRFFFFFLASSARLYCISFAEMLVCIRMLQYFEKSDSRCAGIVRRR